MNRKKKKGLFTGEHKAKFMALDFIKYIGPGLIVTVGFIDPGNWASNLMAGSAYGYALLFTITLSTIMLIILQHNAAHLGIATGYCLSEAASIYLKPWLSRSILITATLAAASTAMAEILGSAIALNMLFKIPIKLGSVMALILIVWMLFTNSYKKLEKWIIGFVSLIGISFIIELAFISVDWGKAVVSWVTPNFPKGAMPIIMSVIGAVVMPHNLFLHSEIIQSRQWNLKDEAIIEKQLKYEFADTLFSMIVGWAINSAMVLIAAATFFSNKINITDLGQARQMLEPLLGRGAAVIFAIALLFAGISSTITAGMAAGSIFAGIYKEPYDINDPHTKIGVGATLITAILIIFFIEDPFKGLIYSQMFLSIQLPITVFLQIYLTSSKKVMGKYSNDVFSKIVLGIIAVIITILNLMLILNV
ncbi:Mg2+/Co2+ transporter [Clostridium carboxidivorans P7]|uniref:Natural resistance-associated macrophage protein n=1 Tax=Clostridium carboxidivorans P7 TaxID=536227 RepID=C6PU76_9CLOT|nr:Nramp family divalent metal transporter [Clostridium carboxidivorans]AKN31380.1 Mg2+/Co2+ transporter [Clostridium carboxidivorans P7]EET87174.1 natural resistance-associated macrophage protein [Clostridium carboxidivorans P7]EFG87228.1 metal ion transporter, metal ion (Mn2+/Fe2+) transporter (Nramp) family protein [Clostridium carboxidivorans P7]